VIIEARAKGLRVVSLDLDPALRFGLHASLDACRRRRICSAFAITPSMRSRPSRRTIEAPRARIVASFHNGAVLRPGGLSRAADASNRKTL